MYGTVRTVVWEDGGSNPASYPIKPSVRHSVDAVHVWMAYGDTRFIRFTSASAIEFVLAGFEEP